ncbi:MAG: hypothetical protein Kow006_22150 [Gammaproteobacteria bacterium]
MDQNYYDSVTRLEEMGVHPDYILGWQGGYLRNPPLEEQRLTEPYSAGYEDGLNRNTDHAEEWLAS